MALSEMPKRRAASCIVTLSRSASTTPVTLASGEGYTPRRGRAGPQTATSCAYGGYRRFFLRDARAAFLFFFAVGFLVWPRMDPSFSSIT